MSLFEVGWRVLFTFNTASIRSGKINTDTEFFNQVSLKQTNEVTAAHQRNHDLEMMKDQSKTMKTNRCTRNCQQQNYNCLRIASFSFASDWFRVTQI